MLRNVLGSFASAFVGVLVGGVTLSILFRAGSFEGLVFMCEMVGIATLPVWLLILLPLYTLVPRTSCDGGSGCPLRVFAFHQQRSELQRDRLDG
jgi:hypothetical protein